jgi:hypothetical protein
VVNDTVLEHPLVRDYLRRLNIACASLPLAQARELREQIATHLDEALPPGAATDEVRTELSRLGSPRSLAAAVAGPGRRSVVRRLLNLLARVRWWAWVAIAALVALAGSALTYALLALSATMTQGPVSTWYYPQDQARSKMTDTRLATTFSAPERFGQQQGVEISVFNDSDWTQTVVGVDPDWRPFGGSSVQVAVGSGKSAEAGDSLDGPVRWSSSGSIPPHAYRLLRVLWTSDMCLNPGTGTSVLEEGTSIQELLLTVHIGIFTRTEKIPLYYIWVLKGASSPPCH